MASIFGNRKLIGLLALAIAATLAFAASPAFAGYVNTSTFSGEGSGDGQLAQFPGRAAVEQSTGNLFVVDQGNNRVQVFKPNGSGSADYLTQFGGGELSAPWGIAIDENAGQTSVYVADAGNSRIVKYDSDEAATPSFSVDGSFASPSATEVGNFKVPLAVDPSTHDLLLADPTDNLMQRYEADGTPDGSFDGSAGAGSPGTFTGLVDVAVNSGGDIYVVDASGNIVNSEGSSQALRYSAAGSYKATLTPVGDNQRSATVAVNPDNDDVVVSGEQDAVYRDASPTLHLFDVANNSLGSPSLSDQWGSVSGLAFSSNFLYVVLYPGLYLGAPYGGTPQIQAYEEVQPATVAATAATDVAELTATVNGTVNPEGSATTCRFEYSTDTSFAQSAPCVEDPGAGTSPVAVHADLPGLSPNATYSFRLAASSYGGQVVSVSNTETFDTLHVDLPAVSIDPLTGITGTSADVTGTVDPQGFDATARFEYSSDGGATWSHGQLHDASTDPELADSTSPVGIAEQLAGLVPNTNYLVRLAATNPAGSATSANKALSTARAAPTVQTLPAGQMSSDSVAMKGRVNPNGEATTYYFEYGTSAAYGARLPAQTTEAGEGKEFITLGQLLYGLSSRTTYHYRIVAVNGTGSSVGEDVEFTTLSETSCPNEEFRAGLSASLPDCRAFELVSPQDNAGVPANSLGTPITGIDGNSVVWGGSGAMPGTGAVNGNANDYFSSRTGDRWDTRATTPPSDSSKGAGVSTVSLVRWRAEDLSRVVLAGGDHSLFPGEAPAGLDRALYLQEAGSQQVKWITRPTVPDPSGNPRFALAGASPDLSRVVFTATPEIQGEPVRLVPEDADRVGGPGVEAGRGVYEYVGGQLRAVGILPDGTIPPRGATTPEPDPTGSGEKLNNQVSRDGRRVVFIAAPTGETFDALYMRVEDEGVAPRTVLVSKSMLTGLPVEGGFGYASSDGSTVWFGASEQLTVDAPLTGGIYRFDLGNETVIYVPNIGKPYESSSDGSRFIYVDPSTSELWASDHDVLSPISPIDIYTQFFRDARVMRATPDGSRFLYVTSEQFGGGQFNNGGGFRQAYVYDFNNKTLKCVSCPPEGVQPSGDTHISSGFAEAPSASIKPRSERALTSDGRRVFFDTPDPLDGRDVNGKRDVYEWTDEGTFLISGGTGEMPSFVADITPSGDDAFFATANQLTRFDVDDEVDIYDARVGGGFRPPPLTDPCDLDCQGTPSDPPPSLTLGSNQFEGSGNLRDCTQLAARVAKAKKGVHRAGNKSRRLKAKKHLRGLRKKAARCRAEGES